MLGYDDKRNFLRLMVNAPCEVTIKDNESNRIVHAVCRDISSTGMSLEIGESSVEIGTQVEVSIESTSTQISSLLVKAKVVRCEPQGENACVVGVEISEMK
ncbi:PilZ domain-containing protein [Alteromonas sp. ASW11-36]|uniref:PilZ domain-containing protein n=1 Tax=Alteromonas arenosi TaxID=3055817 RepID=A0ABT7SXY6_9ALTE|nr:PilZ domain-containing protein [Alteromonas sp. ASW11-36]MDM7861056.1 PilZ domain-containing protein [Alteromonas sp. ASW11-36]